MDGKTGKDATFQLWFQLVRSERMGVAGEGAGVTGVRNLAPLQIGSPCSMRSRGLAVEGVRVREEINGVADCQMFDRRLSHRGPLEG